MTTSGMQRRPFEGRHLVQLDQENKNQGTNENHHNISKYFRFHVEAKIYNKNIMEKQEFLVFWYCIYYF